MIYPAADTLDTKYSKYALVIVSAKRAKQIKDGARLMIEDADSINPLTLALEELAAGEIIPIMVGDPERLPTSLPPTPVLGGLNASLMDDEDSTSSGWMDADMSDIKDALSMDDILPISEYPIEAASAISTDDDYPLSLHDSDMDPNEENDEESEQDFHDNEE